MSTSDPLRPRSDAEPALNLPGVARLMATGLGMIVILIGLWAVLKVFLGILMLFTTPDKMSAGLAAWSQALANVEVAADINGQKVDFKGLLVVGTYWLGWIVLSWLALGMLLAGAKIISWTTTDHEAVKRVLSEALGNWRERHERTE